MFDAGDRAWLAFIFAALLVFTGHPILAFWIFVFGSLVGYRWYSGYQYNHSSYH